MTTKSDDIVEAVRSAMALAWAEVKPTLTPAPANGKCECGHDEFILITEGVSALYTIRYQTDHWHAWTDGWDDIDDSPIASWLCCRECGNAYSTPDEMDWN